MRAVIAEDQVLLREGLHLVLEAAGYDVVGSVANQPAPLAVVATERPDLVVTDIRMPPTFHGEGLVAALQIRAGYPGTAVLVLSHCT